MYATNATETGKRMGQTDHLSGAVLALIQARALNVAALGRSSPQTRWQKLSETTSGSRIDVKTLADITEKLEQHKDNLRLWKNGYLAPTEPDANEREAIMRELKAAIVTLEWVLSDTQLPL